MEFSVCGPIEKRRVGLIHRVRLWWKSLGPYIGLGLYIYISVGLHVSLIKRYRPYRAVMVSKYSEGKEKIVSYIILSEKFHL